MSLNHESMGPVLNSEVDVNRSALHVERARISRFKVALRQQEDPYFGVCAECSDTIPRSRLMYFPRETQCELCLGG